MCTENTEEYTYEYIVKAFGKEKIDARYEHIKKRMIHFIARTGATDIYLLNESILKDTITDYFADIKRLKEFQNIEHTNKNKITAYMAYWILRRKPIQVTIDDCKYEFLYPNEQFVASLIMKELIPENSDLFKKSDSFKLLGKHLMYHLRFRNVEAHSLELFIEGVRTGIDMGRLCQNTTSGKMDQ